MITGYLFVHREVDYTTDPFERNESDPISSATMNGTNRVYHRDPTCSGRGNPRDGVIVSVAVPIDETGGLALMSGGKARVRECRHCRGYVSPNAVDSTWRNVAACRDVDEPTLWFSTSQDERELAIGICRTCPVAGECLRFAIVTRQSFGVWGGLDEESREGHSGKTAASILWDEYDSLTLDLEFEKVPE